MLVVIWAMTNDNSAVSFIALIADAFSIHLVGEVQRDAVVSLNQTSTFAVPKYEQTLH